MALSDYSRHFLVLHENSEHRHLPGLQELDDALIEMSGMEPTNPAWGNARRRLSDAAKVVATHNMVATGTLIHVRRAIFELAKPRDKSIGHIRYLIDQMVVGIKAYATTHPRTIAASTDATVIRFPSSQTTSLVATN